MEIYNLLGQRVQSVNSNSNNLNVINISELNSGMYMLKVVTEKGTSVRRFVKE